MIMETNINFIEAKMTFIRDFMNSTRPADELDAFIKAFDTCKPMPLFDESMIAVPSEPLKIVPSEEPHVETPSILPEKVIKYKKRRPVIHDGKKPSAHPHAKMVNVSFFGRNDYYASMTAAASAMNITLAQLQYALKHNKLVNGQEVSLQDADKIFQNTSKSK